MTKCHYVNFICNKLGVNCLKCGVDPFACHAVLYLLYCTFDSKNVGFDFFLVVAMVEFGLINFKRGKFRVEEITIGHLRKCIGVLTGDKFCRIRIGFPRVLSQYKVTRKDCS